MVAFPLQMHAPRRRGLAGAFRVVFANALSAAFVALPALVACGDPDPSSVRLDLIFPSPQLALSADQIEFVVYDDPVEGACERIYLKRLANETTGLPPESLRRAPAPLCQVMLGKTAPLDLPMGKHSILVAAKRANADLLVGCSDVTVTPDTNAVAVNLALPGTTIVSEPSKCTSIRDYCSNPQKPCQ